VVAEDLGLITPEVEELRDELGYPGMRVLQFAFDGSRDNPHLPANHSENSVAYTGTHDNDTAVGWWLSASPAEREQVAAALGGRSGEVEWLLMEMVARSEARLAVFPAQDLLGLGSHARMNTPGTAADNWSWRLDPDSLDPGLLLRLRELTDRTGRLAAGGGTDTTPERRTTS
jgi:4-alpha-glucanotransferase